MKNPAFSILAVVALSLACVAQREKPSPAVRTVSASPAQTPELRDSARVESNNKPLQPQLTLPVGTAIRMKLETAIYTSSNRSGDPFAGRVLEDVRLGDQIVIPIGASLQGEVTRIAEPRRIKGKPMIQLKLESVTMPNGERYSLSATVVDTNKINGTNVDGEGRITGRTRSTRDNLELGAGAGVGAVVGGVVDGVKGSFIGAGIGAGGAMVHWLTKRNATSLPAGSELIFELSRPLAITTMATP